MSIRPRLRLRALNWAARSAARFNKALDDMIIEMDEDLKRHRKTMEAANKTRQSDKED